MINLPEMISRQLQSLFLAFQAASGHDVPGNTDQSEASITPNDQSEASITSTDQSEPSITPTDQSDASITPPTDQSDATMPPGKLNNSPNKWVLERELKLDELFLESQEHCLHFLAFCTLRLIMQSRI